MAQEEEVVDIDLNDPGKVKSWFPACLLQFRYSREFLSELSLDLLFEIMECVYYMERITCEHFFISL